MRSAPPRRALDYTADQAAHGKLAIWWGSIHWRQRSLACSVLWQRLMQLKELEIILVSANRVDAVASKAHESEA